MGDEELPAAFGREPRPDDRGAGAVGVGLEHGGAVDRPAGRAAGIAQAAPVGGDGAEVDREDRAGPARRVVVGGRGHRRRPRTTGPLERPLVVGRQIVELGELALEGQPHDAGRAVALLGHDHLGLAVGLLAALLPGVVALVEALVALLGAPRRLRAREVVLLAIDEHDDVGVLLDRARFAQVGELRPLVLALLDGAAELRQRQHRHVELLGQRLEAAGDLRDLLHAVLLARLARGAEELEVVDDQQAEPVRALQPAGAGAQRGDRQRRRVVDEEVQVLELVADRQDLVEVAADQLALADLLRRDLGLLGEHAGGELLGRHFEREEADHRAVDRLGLAVLDDAPRDRPWRR